MAFVAKRTRNGKTTFSVEFKRTPASKRESVYLGEIPRPEADKVCRFVESLIDSLDDDVPMSPSTRKWLTAIDGTRLHKKLTKKGLAPTAAETAHVKAAERLTIQELCTRFTESPTSRSRKPRTQAKYRQAVTSLLKYWPANTPIRVITDGDAEEWQAWLMLEGNTRDRKRRDLSLATVGRKTKLARQIFRFAMKHRWLEANPFLSLKIFSDKNEARLFYVTTEVAEDAIAVASGEWRLLIALGRYGGLRVPSEIERMKWKHVDISAGKLTVFAPKTEHHGPSNSFRIVPLFPELRQYFEEFMANQRVAPNRFVFRQLRLHSNPGPQLQRIVKRAGHDPWERIWQNLRSSRATDLVNDFPAKTVAKWLGNSPKVLMDHYAQSTEEDFLRAIGSDANSKTGARTPARTPHTGVQDPTEPQGEDPVIEEIDEKPKKNADSQGNANQRNGVLIGQAGLEPATKGL